MARPSRALAALIVRDRIRHRARREDWIGRRLDTGREVVRIEDQSALIGQIRGRDARDVEATELHAFPVSGPENGGIVDWVGRLGELQVEAEHDGTMLEAVFQLVAQE